MTLPEQGAAYWIFRPGIIKRLYFGRSVIVSTCNAALEMHANGPKREPWNLRGVMFALHRRAFGSGR